MNGSIGEEGGRCTASTSTSTGLQLLTMLAQSPTTVLTNKNSQLVQVSELARHECMTHDAWPVDQYSHRPHTHSEGTAFNGDDADTRRRADGSQGGRPLHSTRDGVGSVIVDAPNAF